MVMKPSGRPTPLSHFPGQATVRVSITLILSGLMILIHIGRTNQQSSLVGGHPARYRAHFRCYLGSRRWTFSFLRSRAPRQFSELLSRLTTNFAFRSPRRPVSSDHVENAFVGKRFDRDASDARVLPRHAPIPLCGESEPSVVREETETRCAHSDVIYYRGHGRLSARILAGQGPQRPNTLFMFRPS